MRIEDIPTEQFNCVVKSLIGAGWKPVYVYDGFDAWIDYREVHLKNGDILVKFIWDNWSEGEISANCEVEAVRALL